MLGPFGLHPKATMLRRALPAARALARRGHAVAVVMPPWHTPSQAGQAWHERVLGAEHPIEINLVSLRGPGLPGADHALVTARMVHAALRFQPDVVHAFKPKAFAGLADTFLHALRRTGLSGPLMRRWARDGAVPDVPPARRSRGTPPRPALVVDTDDWEGPGGWNDAEPYSAGQRRLFARQERWGLTHADAVTVASRALETLAWSLGVPPERVTYLPNAVEAGAAWVEPAGDGDRPPTLLLYTRFFEFDPARPLEVLDRLRRDRPALRLVVAGKGLHGEEQRFLDAARSRGLAEAVDYRGWVEPEAVADLFRAADVALYPFDDTLINRSKSSFKLLELMQAGLPVVAEAVGQNAEVIEDGTSGRLVPSGDIEAFAAAVGALLADAGRRRAMGAAARERIERHYSWARQVVALEAVYRRALER